MDDSRYPATTGSHEVSPATAIDLIVGAARRLPTETVPLELALGRVLARDVHSLTDRPNADDSALDGFACRVADTQLATVERPISLRLVGVSQAGRPYRGTVGPGEAVGIATGAVVPEGADAIVGVEDARQVTPATPAGSAGRVELRAPAARDAVRRRARDLQKGRGYLRSGQRLDAANLGLAAAMGHAALAVVRRPRLALIVTGDELVAPGGSLGLGDVFDANGVALGALTTAAGADLALITSVGDGLEELASAVEQSAATPGGVDLVITSGGVSRGERDAVRDLLLHSGELLFWRVMVRPAGPTMFGRLGDVPVLGLPGNPVSSVVGFLLFARAFIDTALGSERPVPYRERSVAVAAGAFAAGAKEVLHRARLVADGPLLRAVPFEDQSSAVLRSLTESSGLVVVPPQRAYVAGDLVEVIVLTPHLGG